MTTILQVQGMSCPSCIEHVEEALRGAGASEVRVDLQRGTVTAVHEPGISPARLITALEQTGYEAGITPRRCCCG